MQAPPARLAEDENEVLGWDTQWIDSEASQKGVTELPQGGSPAVADGLRVLSGDDSAVIDRSRAAAECSART